MRRRDALTLLALLPMTSRSLAQTTRAVSVKIDPTPKSVIPPRLYMQVMEPLGTTDSSVEAAWDFNTNSWRGDFVAAVRDLAPGAIRWGGIFTSYWKWREGVGPRERRIPMINYLWGGLESNQIGLDEVLELCSTVAAEPIIGINFAGDGRPEYISTVRGERRAGTAEEAADLVRYCNDPDYRERHANGRPAPWGVKLWQIGNETSYPAPGHRFTRMENCREYRVFAEAMRAADPSVQLIGWGDQELDTGHWWAEELLRNAGDAVDFVALHMMHQTPDSPNTLLKGREYRRDYHAAWDELCAIYRKVEHKLMEARQVIRGIDPAKRVAITEGHLSLQPHNKCEILREWISALYHARVLNLYERNADFVEVATLADFEGTTWLSNAVMLGSPREPPYLLPAGHVMRLYKAHGGSLQIDATVEETTLDISCSRTRNTLYLHVVNTDLEGATKAEISVAGAQPDRAYAHEIAPGDLSAAIDTTALDIFKVAKHRIPVNAGVIAGSFPKASVTSLEIEL
jgi:alpha-N-arabinofuranosidase